MSTYSAAGLAEYAGSKVSLDCTPCTPIGCLIDCLQPMVTSSTLSARRTHLRAAARTRVGTEVCPNAVASTLCSRSSSCRVLVSCLVPTAVTRTSRVQTSVANGRGGEMECSRRCDTETQTCFRIRASPVVYPEDLSQEETVEPEIQGGVPRTYRSWRLDCQFGTSFMTIQNVSGSGRQCILDIEFEVSHPPARLS